MAIDDNVTNGAEQCEHCGGDLSEDCDGRGWVRVADGGAGSVRRCPAGQGRITEGLLSRCGVPDLYLGCTVDGFVSDGMRGQRQLADAREVCRAYVRAFSLAGDARTTRGLLFVGPPGTGKTHLAAAVLQALVRLHGARGLFIDFNTLCHEIRATFDDAETSEARVLRPLLETQVLVLDELGAQRPTPFVQDTLYLVINTRYARRLPTIFTTNHPLDGSPRADAARARPVPASLDRATGPRRADPTGEEFPPLSERVGPRIYSRLFEAAMEPVVFDQADDYRRRLLQPVPR